MGSVYDLSLTPEQQAAFSDHTQDFNFDPRSSSFRGAYAGEGTNPGWLPALDFKPEPALFADGFESGDPLRWSSVQP